MNAVAGMGRYMPRERVPDRRPNWRQKVAITDNEIGRHTFYVEFGEYPDGRLAELFIVAHRHNTFARGTLDALARSASLALQSGTAPHEMAHTLMDMTYPPSGAVDAPSSTVKTCTSLADYIAQEIMASYGADGRRLPNDAV